MRYRHALALLAAATTACSSSGSSPTTDASTTDAAGNQGHDAGSTADAGQLGDARSPGDATASGDGTVAGDASVSDASLSDASAADADDAGTTDAPSSLADGAPTDGAASDSSDAMPADGGVVDAGASDATQLDAASDASGPTTNDPFDPASCQGAPITQAEFFAKFAAGSTGADLGAYNLLTRTRSCDPITGCSAWSTGSNAVATIPPGESTWIGGGYPLKGEACFVLFAAGWIAPGTSETPGLVFEDQQSGPPSDWNSFTHILNLSHVETAAAGASGVMTFTVHNSGTYGYGLEDNWLVPPTPVEGYVPSIAGTNTVAVFSATVTNACVRLVSGASAQETTQYAALVRF
jgi:hypothetical protein